VISAPKRLFIAGIGDALATWFESQANKASDSANYVGAGYRSCLAGMAVSKMCYDILLSDAVSALRALDRGVVTEAVENIIEANTLLSGLGFHNTGLSAAHGIHSGMTSLPSTHKYLHGEKVSFGIVFQMILENRPTEEVNKIMKFMVEVGLPVTLEQVGIEATEENISTLAKKTYENALIHHEPFRVTEGRVYAAIVTADELGKSYLK
ncbi:MAG: iron-containing alcohol dehydrogenase, partial [Clostridia bacterium]|nr:iron-containing alcohol dehydrogenase [Clostridia bacterium]